MKTQETIKQEIINYLTKTSQHTFSYEDGSLFKVVKDGDNFYTVDEKSSFPVKKINIDNTVAYYENNAKCVLKHRLFLNRPVKSIKSNKFNKTQVDTLLLGKNTSTVNF
jgi:hypothetical protein